MEIDEVTLSRLRLSVTSLELYLDKNFRGMKDGRALVLKPVSAD